MIGSLFLGLATFMPPSPPFKLLAAWISKLDPGDYGVDSHADPQAKYRPNRPWIARGHSVDDYENKVDDDVNPEVHLEFTLNLCPIFVVEGFFPRLLLPLLLGRKSRFLGYPQFGRACKKALAKAGICPALIPHSDPKNLFDWIRVSEPLSSH